MKQEFSVDSYTLPSNTHGYVITSYYGASFNRFQIFVAQSTLETSKADSFDEMPESFQIY